MTVRLTSTLAAIVILPTCVMAQPLAISDGEFSLCDYHNQPEPTNLIPNAGFEDGDEGWTLVSTASIDEEIAHSGARSVRLHIPAGEPGKSNLGITVEVKPTTRYRCELWIRRENVGVTGTYVSERDDEGNLTGTRTQYGRTVPDVDGVWHHQVWDLTTQPETTRLNIRGDIYNSTGTIWLDDFAIFEFSEGIYQPVEMTSTAEGGAVKLSGALPDADLELEATATDLEGGGVRIDGVVRDTTGGDRAVGVRFSLPIDAEGWTWWLDAEEREQIGAGGLYRHTYDCKAGIGVCSIYPWACISGPERAVTMALPLSQGPRCFVLQHDQRKPALQATFYFGLAADAGNNPSRAPFSLVIYDHDAQWGMRSAMERYYELFPESFEARPTPERYLNYANLERLDPETHELIVSRSARLPDASDFGEGYRFIDHVHGCYDFRMVPYDDPERPSDEIVMGLLQEMVEEEQEKPRHYVPTRETLKKLVYGPEGQIRYIGDTRYWRPHEGYNHNDWPGWGLNFHVNEDPGVSDFLAEETRRQFEEYAAEGEHLPFEATVTADAIEGYHALSRYPNFRREHFATTLLPLTFGKESLQPCIPNAIWDFHHKAWWPLTDEYEVAVYGNANGYEQFFVLPYVDVPMVEWSWDRSNRGRFERYLRATAHHKIWRFWRVCAAGVSQGEDDPEIVRKHFERGLAYAIYPAVYPLPETAGRDYRYLYRQYVPAIEQLLHAGWEPVPHARASEGVIVERFGSFADGELHLTLRNYDDEGVSTAVALDREALGIPADVELVAVELLCGRPETIAFSGEGTAPGAVAVSDFIEVDADGSAAYWIGTRAQLSDRGFRLAGRTLAKIERMFLTDLTEETRGMLAHAKALAERGQAASGTEACRMAIELADAADALQEAMETDAPVDLAKLVMRIHAELACVAAGEMGIEPSAPRVVEAARGETAEVRIDLSKSDPAVSTRLMSPWPEFAKALSPPHAVTADARTLVAAIDVSADPERTLLPFVSEVRTDDWMSAVLYDVVLTKPLAITPAPTRVFRGDERRIDLSVTGQWSAQVTVALKPPTGVTAEPAEFSLQVGAEAVTHPVTLRLEETVRLGSMTVGWEATSEDARYNVSGEFKLGVAEPVPTITIGASAEPPEIDGELDDAAWQGDPSIPALNLLAGGKPATENTAVWVTYDDEAVYIAFRCEESQMSKLVATYQDRGDPLYRDDDVEVFILTPGAKRSLQLAVNPLGTISDSFGNDTPWTAAAHQYDDRWTVEIAIPWEVVGARGRPEAGTSWGMQFGRQQKAKGETTAWTPGRAFNVPEGFGLVVFE